MGQRMSSEQSNMKRHQYQLVSTNDELLEVELQNRTIIVKSKQEEKSYEVVKKTIDSPIYTNGSNMLHFACHNGFLESVKALVAKKANVNLENHKGLTPLDLAVMNDHFNVAKYLLESNANINFSSKAGITCLNYMVRLGEIESVKFLIENGANVNAKMDSGKTILMVKSVKNELIIMKLLLQSGADPHINYKNINILDIIIINNVTWLTDGIKLLRKYGVKPTMKHTVTKEIQELLDGNELTFAETDEEFMVAMNLWEQQNLENLENLEIFDAFESV